VIGILKQSLVVAVVPRTAIPALVCVFTTRLVARLSKWDLVMSAGFNGLGSRRPRWLNSPSLSSIFGLG
jgi:hypothetical protein